MKKLFYLFLLTVSLVANAQTKQVKLCPEMSAFYHYCLDVRNGVQKKDISILEKCIEGWNGDEKKLKYDKIELEFSPLQNLQPVDSTCQADLKGHLWFSPAFIDSLLTYGDTLYNFTDIPECMRGFTEAPDFVRGGTADCYYTHIAIKAKKQVKLAFQAGGECELFLVTENGSNITTTLTKESEKEPFLKETCDAPCFQWEMDSCKYYVTIKNPTKTNISIIVVSN